MDRRSWPWKKKSSAKETTTDSKGKQGDKDNTKNVNYVEIPVETYSKLIKFEDKVKILKEKLSSAQSEMINKDMLVKQHAKVAEEAVSGWEKAEAEALALKQHLESVTLEKLTAENRASNLDGALRECMKQMKILEVESEQKLQDIIFTKTKQWENVRSELEEKLINFEQKLLRCSAENSLLSISLQERSNLLMMISEQKSQADADIEILKTNIQSCEREINSLKYEHHIIMKELEIRTEEKNMGIRSTEAANKQRIEDVRKIAKLEADCQRLRSLVRKKLPGNAALAQMKLEVESLGRDHFETRLQQPNAISSFARSSPKSSFENNQQCDKEKEFLAARLLDMEEEIKMHKEALFMTNNELNASRNMYAKTANKLRSLEVYKVLNEQKSPSKPNSNRIRNLTSMSEDGIDEVGSCSESCTMSLISELSPYKKEKIDSDKMSVTSSHLELMDDFLEMERLACSSMESNVMDKTKVGISDGTSSIDVHMDVHKVSIENPSPEKQGNNSCMETKCDVDGLRNAISQIHDIVVPLCKRIIEIQGKSSDDHGLRENFERFCTFVDKIPHKEISLDDYICALSHILSETNKLSTNMWSGRPIETEITSIDCIDKVTLLEKKVVQHEATKDRSYITLSYSDPEISRGPTIPFSELKAGSIEEFEQMKLEKSNMQIDLARCNETLEHAKLQLVEAEQRLTELKSQLASCQMSNSLAETRLRCMTESYESLELQKKELDTEVNHLRKKADALYHDLQEERRDHQEDLERYNDLEEKMERNATCTTCSYHSEADIAKINQGKEYAAAAEKLAECQESIFLLGKQLKALHSPIDSDSSSSAIVQTSDDFSENEPLDTQNTKQSSQSQQNSSENEPLDTQNTKQSSQSQQNVVAPDTQERISGVPTGLKRPKQRSRSASSSSLASMLGEKQGRSFSRFFFQTKE